MTAIQDLIVRAEAIEDTPTILPGEGLKDYRLAGRKTLPSLPHPTVSVNSRSQPSTFRTPLIIFSIPGNSSHNPLNPRKVAHDQGT